MRVALLSHVDPAVAQHLGGNTDSEAIRACSPINLFISDGDSILALRYAFDFGHYDEALPDSAGSSMHSFPSLWCTTGAEYGFHEGEWQMAGGAPLLDSILVASEPLTRDTSTWLEVPEYSVLHASRRGGGKGLQVRYLDAG